MRTRKGVNREMDKSIMVSDISMIYDHTPTDACDRVTSTRRRSVNKVNGKGI